MTEIFAAWMLWLSQAGVDVDRHMMPPATETELAVLEELVGTELPGDLRALYLVSNGQADWTKVQPAAGKYSVAFFGSYEFLSISAAMDEYKIWQQIRDEAGVSFHADFNEGIITSRHGDPVAPEYWQPGWLPFARDGGGNYYAVDLSPMPGGTYGQIIIAGPDEDERRVLAGSLSEFFSARMQVPIQSDIDEGRILLFEMEIDAQAPAAQMPVSPGPANPSSGIAGWLKRFFS
jgi:cell wall assembly regulator SMI1